MVGAIEQLEPRALRSQEMSDDELARRGVEIYCRLAPEIEAKNLGRHVAIAVETGEYQLADTSIQADDGLRARYPDAVFFYVHIGFPTAARLASWRR
jgi:hypothetical protein